MEGHWKVKVVRAGVDTVVVTKVTCMEPTRTSEPGGLTFAIHFY
jgi:hypothetical protein